MLPHDYVENVWQIFKYKLKKLFSLNIIGINCETSVLLNTAHEI